MKKLWQKYRFWVVGITAIVWMTVFDSNNFIDLIELRREIGDLKSKKAYYSTEITLARKTQLELFSNTRNLEKFAREKYYMKKDNEDLFIFRESKKK
ncbi:MAG: septum formation initiator family protein [bacterium]|nr:septum formation initiator family protein [bacterium]